MRYDVKGVAGLSGVERTLMIDAESVKAAISSAKKQGIFPVLVTPLDESADFDSTSATASSASDTDSDRRRPLLVRCPACRKRFSETAEACPKCGHVIDEPTRGELTSAAMREQQITKIAGIVFAVAFLIMFLMCLGAPRERGRGGSDFHRARDIQREYDNRMDRLGDIYDETISDPYTTDEEFRRRLDEIQAIPDDF